MATNQPTNTVQPEGSLRPSIETEPARASSSKKSFTVPGGYLKGVYDGVLLSTDLEPDDAVAIKLLAPELRGVPMLVVVGQGPSDKTQLAVQMLAAYDIGSSARVVQGQTSEVPFPTQMIDLYASASSSSAILKPEIVAGGDAAALTADFLARCSAPFALLLKPPHEMANLDTTILGKTTAAVYGSFNLATFRAALPASLSEEEKLLRQEALLHSFKLALWVERSLSVGRDSVLESEKFDGGGKKLWDCLLADKELVGMIGAWNAQTLKTFAPKVSKGMNEIKAICDKSTVGPDATSPLWPELLVLLEGIDKKVQVMKSITKCKGSQVCAALSPPQARAICRPRVTCRPWPRFLAHSLPLSFPRALASDPFASGVCRSAMPIRSWPLCCSTIRMLSCRTRKSAVRATMRSSSPNRSSTGAKIAVWRCLWLQRRKGTISRPRPLASSPLVPLARCRQIVLARPSRASHRTRGRPGATCSATH
jgi:hypothetical protein